MLGFCVGNLTGPLQCQMVFSLPGSGVLNRSIQLYSVNFMV